jgi:hypothetical protein
VQNLKKIATEDLGNICDRDRYYKFHVAVNFEAFRKLKDELV